MKIKHVAIVIACVFAVINRLETQPRDVSAYRQAFKIANDPTQDPDIRLEKITFVSLALDERRVTPGELGESDRFHFIGVATERIYQARDAKLLSALPNPASP